MAFQIIITNINEETGSQSTYFNKNVYLTKALAQYFANKEIQELGMYGCGWADVITANNDVIIKEKKSTNRAQQAYRYYYGCPEHAMFGDEWFFGLDNY